MKALAFKVLLYFVNTYICGLGKLLNYVVTIYIIYAIESISYRYHNASVKI